MSKFDLLQAALWSVTGLWIAFAAKRELRKRNEATEKRWKGGTDDES